MEIKTYEVTGRTKRSAISVASISDFILLPALFQRDPYYLIDTVGIFPYCIDIIQSEVVFVELPEQIELISMSFVYEAQYHYAKYVHTVKLGSFINMTAEIRTSARALLLHSTGRCGSTLLTRALADMPNIMSYSEPDVFSQLAMIGRLPVPRARQMLMALFAGLLQFFMRHHKGFVAFKFRSIVCEQADYLATSLPSSSSIFLYRNGYEVARSYARVTNRPLSGWQLSEGQQRAWTKFAPIIARLEPPVYGHDLMAALWAGPILRYLETWPSGMWRCAIDYADLISQPTNIIPAIIGDVEQGSEFVLQRPPVFATHSQAESHMAPGLTEPNPELEMELTSPEFIERIARSLLRIDGRLQAEMTLSGTFSG